jgi:hypothetical protein
MSRALAITALFAAFVAPTALADDREEQFMAEIQNLTPELQTVATGGRWFRGSTVGTFRLVVRQLGFEFHRDHAFLQWIRLSDDATQPDVVERTISIDEVVGLITTHRFARAGNRWKLLLQSEWLDRASDPPKKRHRYFVITPSADYTYSCRESTGEPDI